jgi:hypothetical protein
VSARNLIVGMMNGFAVAMPLGGALVNLPLGPGQWSHAHGVNARGQVVGNLNLGTLTAPDLVPAFWPSTTTTPIILKYPGEAVDINDHGLVVGTIGWNGLEYGIVGTTNNRASFGDPHHAGLFAAAGISRAWGVNDRGVATGDDAGSSPGWPQNTAAFVADRGGAFTVLPMPSNPNGFAWRASYGYGINACGVVVGTGWAFPGHPYTAQPMVWDPGC